MQERQGDGVSFREHLLSVQKITGKAQPELNGPELPEGAYYVWSWFVKLSSARTSNGFGLNPISYTEMKCFFDLEGVYPSDWELDILRRLDYMALEQSHRESKKQEQKNSKK